MYILRHLYDRLTISNTLQYTLGLKEAAEEEDCGGCKAFDEGNVVVTAVKV